MHELCYLPKPTEFEGPKSLLMRMAHYNGFGTVRNMCAYFSITPRRWVDVLGQSSPLLKIVDKEAPLLADGLRKAFYNVAEDSSNFIKADEIHLLRGACPNNFYYCPQCIESSQSPVFHDIRDIGMCLLHGTELVTNCPNCRTTEIWYNAQLFHCKCDFERSTARRIVANFTPCLLDPFQSPQVVEDIGLKHVIAKVCASLWDARRDDGNHKCCDLPLKVINHINMTVAAQVAKYPGFMKSLHRAPWINYSSTSVAWLADRALSRLCISSQSCPDDCCRFATIDRNNARRAMFDDLQLTELRRCIVLGWLEQQSPFHFTRPPRCEIIRKMNAEYSSSVEQSSANPDGLTKDEVAALLKCPLSAINDLLRQGWLKKLDQTLIFQPHLAEVLDRPSTEQFAKQYILLHELCDTFNLPDHLLANLLYDARLQKNGCSGPLFSPRASTLALLSQLPNHGSLRIDDVQRSPVEIMPDTLKDIRYALMQINTFQKDQSARMPDPKPK